MYCIDCIDGHTVYSYDRMMIKVKYQSAYINDVEYGSIFIKEIFRKTSIFNMCLLHIFFSQIFLKGEHLNWKVYSTLSRGTHI